MSFELITKNVKGIFFLELPKKTDWNTQRSHWQTNRTDIEPRESALSPDNRGFSHDIDTIYVNKIDLAKFLQGNSYKKSPILIYLWSLKPPKDTKTEYNEMSPRKQQVMNGDEINSRNNTSFFDDTSAGLLVNDWLILIVFKDPKTLPNIPWSGT